MQFFCDTFFHELSVDHSHTWIAKCLKAYTSMNFNSVFHKCLSPYGLKGPRKEKKHGTWEKATLLLLLWVSETRVAPDADKTPFKWLSD